MNPMRISQILLLALLLSAPGLAPAVDDAMRCGQRLIKAGDPIWRVADRCPEPFWQESYDRPRAVSRHGRIFGVDRVERWTINFGASRFMRQLEFVNGRLSRIRNLGYGTEYTPGSRGCGPYELTRAGDTIAEIFARCGAPDHRYELPAFGYHGGGPAGRHQVWTYRFGPRQQAREVRFLNGRLRQISPL